MFESNDSISNRMRAIAFTVLVGVGALGATAMGQDVAEKVDLVRDTIDQVMETRRLISQEARDWAVGKEVLSAQIANYTEQIESLRSSLAEVEARIAEAEARRTAAESEIAATSAVSKLLVERLAGCETKVKKVIGRLPAPLAETVRPFSQSLPKDPFESDIAIGVRYMNVIGTLNAINKFNGEVSSQPEVIDLGNGTTGEVDVVYLGLGQAYYANATGTFGGMGRAGKDAWIWKPRNDVGADIRKVFEILADQGRAEYVSLPLLGAAEGN